MEINRLVVLTHTNSVGINNKYFDNLDLSSCGIPDNVWALQWNEHGDNTGHIEYKGADTQNTEITELPTWAAPCVTKWQEADAAEQALLNSLNEPATPV